MVTYQPDPATYWINVQLALGRKHMDVRLFANNVLNSLPALQHNLDVPDSTLTYTYTFRPRTVGIIANWTI
jgi:hypothetical protein